MWVGGGGSDGGAALDLETFPDEFGVFLVCFGVGAPDDAQAVAGAGGVGRRSGEAAGVGVEGVGVGSSWGCIGPRGMTYEGFGNVLRLLDLPRPAGGSLEDFVNSTGFPAGEKGASGVKVQSAEGGEIAF